MTPPPSPSAAPARRGRGAYDRVGGTRLSGVGALLLLAVVVGVASPPQVADREVMVLLWCLLVGLLVIGVVWPMVAVRRVAVTAVSPRDAVVGERVPVEVAVSGRARSCEVRLLDPTSAWHRVSGPGGGTIAHLADQRGLFAYLRVEVRVSAPLGVAAAHRVHDVQLPVVVEVAPRPLAVDWLPAPAPIAGDAEAGALAALGGEVVRSVRPYVAGDPSHLVHWPSTARTGSVVVRELEPPVPVGQAIIVDLRELGPETERAASYAMGAARAVLAVGGRLVLCTAEASGPVSEEVRFPIDAGRRLARAVLGPPGEPPEGWPVVEIGR